MISLETLLRGFWLGVGTHLWQTTLVLLLLALLGSALRRAPARYLETLGWIALAKLFVPFAVLAPLVTGLVSPARARPSFVVQVLVDPLGAVSSPPAPSGFGWTVLSALYLVGVVLVAARALVPAARCARNARPLVSASAEVRARIAEALRASGLSSQHIAIAASATAPAVVGILRPRVHVSERAVLALEPEALRLVLLHEAEHVRRRDPLRGTVATAALATFFYYPPVWLVVRRLRAAAELRCDEAAVRAGSPADYATALGSVVRLGLAAAGAHGAAGSQRPTQFRERLARVREPGRFVAMPRHRLALAAAVVVVGLGSLVPVASGPREARVARPAEPAQPAEPARPAEPAEPAEPLILTDGSGMLAPRIVERVSPAYPADARAARAEGKVVLQAVIERDGTVSEVRVLRGVPAFPSLDEAALSAVRRWRYEPATLHGEPVRVYFTVVVNFTLSIPNELGPGTPVS